MRYALLTLLALGIAFIAGDASGRVTQSLSGNGQFIDGTVERTATFTIPS